MVVLVAVVAAVLAPGVTYLLVRRTTRNPVLWGFLGLVVHLVVGNVTNRWIMPVVWPQPTGTLGFPGPGEYQHGSLAWYEASVHWLNVTTSVSLGIGLLAAAALGLIVRRATRTRERERSAVTPQVVGSTCEVCDARIVAAGFGTWCDRCEAPLHVDCATNHTC